MPVFVRVSIRRVPQGEFRDLSFEVMRHVFAIRNEIGRFFDEGIYKRELANRMTNVRLEEPIDITHRTFKTQLFADALVDGCGLFEFKAVEALMDRHRAQLIQYLMLCGITHGKLINLRSEIVEHEFVNCQWVYSDRTRFDVCTKGWNDSLPGVSNLRDATIEMLRDLGTGLSIPIYEEAIAFLMTGSSRSETEVRVTLNGLDLGNQKFRLIAPGVALKVTTFQSTTERFENHARRLLKHVDLRAIAWINITMTNVAFAILER